MQPCQWLMHIHPHIAGAGYTEQCCTWLRSGGSDLKEGGTIAVREGAGIIAIPDHHLAGIGKDVIGTECIAEVITGDIAAAQ